MEDGGEIGAETGHLFNDSKFSNIYTALDIEEIARTKRANLREELTFRHHASLLQHQRRILVQSHNHEITEIRDKLKDIQAKTPNLVAARSDNEQEEACNGYKSHGYQNNARGSGTEKRRYGLDGRINDSPRQNVHFMKSLSSPNKQIEKHALTLASSNQTEYSPSERTNPERSISLPNLTGHRDDRITTQQKVRISSDSALKLPKLSTSPQKPHGIRLIKQDYRKPLSFQRNSIKPSTRSYIRRATYLAKSLGELYSKRQSEQQATTVQLEKPLPQNNLVAFATYLH